MSDRGNKTICLVSNEEKITKHDRSLWDFHQVKNT